MYSYGMPTGTVFWDRVSGRDLSGTAVTPVVEQPQRIRITHNADHHAFLIFTPQRMREPIDTETRGHREKKIPD